MAKDPYSVLGISREAAPEDIKKAYRNMSKEWHPDKHKGDKKAEDKFKEINEAYETLSNPDKKKMYDQFGTTGGPGAAGAGGFGGFDFNNMGGAAGFGDIFENFFGGGRSHARRNPAEGVDREISLTIDLHDVVTGVKHTFKLQRLVVCEKCKGNGADSGSKIVRCQTCNGTGQTIHTTSSFFGQIQQRRVCEKCDGSGKIPEKACSDCNGEGRYSESRDVTVEIPAGIQEGQVVRVQGQGDAGLRSGKVGELYIHIEVRQDPRFDRDGADIRSAVDVPVIDAILGGTIEIDTVHGKSTVHIPDGTQPGQVFRIRGKGLPHISSRHHGDHYVTVGIAIPTKLSRAERKILEQWRSERG